jgi:pyruvate dehydrogenase E2 component (dihydrolipoamide acetyltransferase)
MSQSFRLPDLGEGVHEAEILAIPVQVGEHVAEGEIILEIETDKAAVEIPSPITGDITAIHVEVGSMAIVGDILLTFDNKKDTLPPAQKATPKRRPVPASPSTRKLARELGVDLYEVKPTGPKGLVTREDVQNHNTRDDEELLPPLPPEKIFPAPHVTAPPSVPGTEERVPFHSIRRATANRMAASWAQIPHVFCQDDVDITRLERFRQKHKEEIEEAGGRLTLTIFAMKAAATALKTYPYFNASLDLEKQEIILKRYFNIGLAVDSEKGLTVPVVKDVDRKSIKELSIEVHQSISAVRKGNHTREQLLGGTFTITNAGALGGHRFSAIINHPEVAILGLGQGRTQPAVIKNDSGKDEIKPRLIMPLMLCFDHRVVDGGDAIRFLKLIIDALEDPEELLITMV